LIGFFERVGNAEVFFELREDLSGGLSGIPGAGGITARNNDANRYLSPTCLSCVHELKRANGECNQVTGQRLRFPEHNPLYCAFRLLALNVCVRNCYVFWGYVECNLPGYFVRRFIETRKGRACVDRFELGE
jgi:hypothetical protein